MLSNPTERPLDPSHAATRAPHLHLATTTPALAPDEVITATGHEAHVHESEHQFLYSLIGHAVVHSGHRAFHLGPDVGLWIPAGVWHSADFDDDCYVLSVCFDADEHALVGDLPSLVPMQRHQRRELLAFHRSTDADTTPGDDLFALLRGESPLLPLPSPQSPLTRAVAAGLGAAPRDPRTLTEWAESLYTSPSTLRRAFINETGLTFSEWRTRARLNASVALLASGTMVSVVSARVGFTSTNGYILAFRRHFGTTPRAFAAQRL